MEPRSKVAIIIVNWNGKDFLADCFDSLKKQTYSNFKIILVDNGSKDDSVNFIKNNYPEIELIELEKNTGFSGGNNAGIKKALENQDIKYIVTLNNDTIVAAQWLESLINIADRDENIGVVGSKMIFDEDHSIINSTAMIPFLDGQGMDRGIWQKDSGQFEKEEEIFGACAGAALYKREALEKVGLFDTDYFLYAEDTDLAWRVCLAGYTAYYAPQAVVYHKQAISSGRFSANTVYYVMRNGIWNVIKNFPVKYILFSIIYLPLRLFILAMGSMKGKGFRSNYVKKQNKLVLLVLVIKAIFHALLDAPKMLKKRKQIKKFKNITDREFRDIIKKYSLPLNKLI